MNRKSVLAGRRWTDTMTAHRQFLIYQSEDGSTRIDVMLEAETLWLP